MSAILEGAQQRIVRRLLPVLMSCYVLAFIDRVNVGFAKLRFSGELHFNDAVFGLGAGIFYVGYAVFEVPSNMLLARIGARRTILRVMLLWGLAAAGFAWMQMPWHYYALRLLLGAAEAGFFPGVLLYLSYWIPNAARARVVAVFMAAIAISGLLGGPLSGLLMKEMDGVLGWSGWRWMFLIEGSATMLAGIAAFFTLTDRPAQARWLSDEEKLALTVALEEEKRSADPVPEGIGFLLNPGFLILCAMSASLLAGGAGLLLWLPSVLATAGGGGAGTIGLLSAIPFAAGLIVQRLIARRSDARGERRLHASIPALIAVASWAVLPFCQHSLLLALIAMTFGIAGYLGATGPFWATPAAYFASRSSPAGIALISTIGAIASAVAPSVVGMLNSAMGTPTAGFLLYAGVMAFGPVCLLLARSTRY